jgi:hypothetical protein
MDPLSLDPDVRVTPSHNDGHESLNGNGVFLGDMPDLSTIAVTEIGVIPPPPMFRSIRSSVWLIPNQLFWLIK